MSFIRGALLGTVALGSLSTVAVAATPSDVLATYGDIAQAAFEDSLTTAKTLQVAIDKLVAEPTEDNLKAARRAWIAARNPYQQTEVYRFGNAIVDDWEGKVNAWPLDEGLIDYVDGAYGNESEENPYYAANIIANAKVTVAGEEIDATEITPALLADQLQEAGEVEANVATGYHAIEFLLWGQDLNGTGKGAGNRPASDFDTANCTGGNCERRVQYLQAATTLLITDLEEMVAAWQADGAARKDLADKGEAAGIATILTGMGSLSYGELAGERMKLGLMLNDPEEEHDCFSDNTHMSHYNDVVGINNVFQGKYTRVDGTVVEGASLKDLLAKADSAVSAELEGKLNASLGAFTALKTRAETTEAYDQMIGEGNTEGNAVVQAAVDSLVDQTSSIERAVKVLKLEQIAFEGSDSLDNPSAVFE
ncbi:imelysin. Metallo peptidase. MEROPS family M75 [Pseudovibrio denitrificans]|uniref:Imelysin. Metallo peptidase. MEROPS family M75 n=1 Tax=Pseudovibrio denitrificans TaxID=258256 RepID=A0A1I7AXA1_9HYPH|nr:MULTISPECIES: imelysin family protein [Pseudovibrio]EEA94983.1 insulin-cleaving metalloproteinase outer membrane protein [Pseudovibrio sp. JE062]SFT79520.1 imelysin. Metallo peptidase. MEROPS family M75 [Pseudovibrio denitrificans]